MLKINLNGREHTFEVTRQGESLDVVWAGEKRRAWVRGQDGYSIVLDFEQANGTYRRICMAGVANGVQRQVWIDGRWFTYERVRPQRQSSAAADGSLAATIPAVVSQILVSPGDVVSAGDKLILLESMKMVIPIQAPYDGRVTKIDCAAGDSVPASVPLLELEPINS
jgi:acetyl/propionyl-CoA carboxylase alpha subunit